MTAQKTKTEIGINEETAEFLEWAASRTGYSKEDMLEYSVQLLDTVLDWRLSSPSAGDLEPNSVEDDLIDILRLALEIERLGGADRIVLERPGRERWAIRPESDSILKSKKKTGRWRRR